MTRGRRLAAMAVAVSAIALDSALIGLAAPLLPEIEERTGVSGLGLGVAFAAYALPILLLSVPLGRLVDSIGRRPVLVAGLLLTAVGSVLIAAVASFPALVIGRGVHGVGAAASWIAALATVADLAPPHRKGEALGFAFAAGSAGAIGGPGIGGIGADAVSFAFPFLLVAGFAIAFAVAAQLLVPRSSRPEAPVPRRGLASLRRAPGYAKLAAPALFVLAATGSLAVVDLVAPLDADERLGLAAAAVGGLLAGSAALDLITAPIAGRVSDRAGRRPVALTGSIVIAIGMLLLAFLPGTAGLATGLVVLGIGLSMLFSSVAPWMDDVFGGRERAFGFGILNLLGALGLTIGPLVAGVAYDLGGPRLAYLLGAAGLFTVALFAGRSPTAGADDDSAALASARP